MNLPKGVRMSRILGEFGYTSGRTAWSPDGSELATCWADQTRILNPESGEILHSIREEFDLVAYSPDGRWLATANRDEVQVRDRDRRPRVVVASKGRGYIPATAGPGITVLMFVSASSLAVGGWFGVEIYDLDRGTCRRRVQFETGVTDMVVSGERLVIATEDGQIGWWDLDIETLVKRLNLGQPGGDQSPRIPSQDGRIAVAAAPNGDVACTDGTQVVIIAGEARLNLESDTAPITHLAYSHSGAVLASQASDGVRLWDGRTGEEITRLDLGGSGSLSFHPTQPVLAVPRRTTIYLLGLDEDVLRSSSQVSVRYTSSKIVLVGDSGVGKTGLGWRLAHGDFKEHASTHGQQFWLLDELAHSRRDGAACEAVLWDLAGQPDYRLVHALFLDDADLALVLFDPTRDDDPLHGVEYWLRHLEARAVRVLVAARSDRGAARLTRDEILRYCSHRGLDGYVVTSALSGEGVGDLVERIKETINWDEKPATVTTVTFKRIKDHVLALREEGGSKAIMTPVELRRVLEADDDIDSFSDAEMLAAVNNLSNHGYVTRLITSRGETRLLLAPDLLNNVAASIVLEARRNERGLGSLEESAVLANTYRFRDLEGLSQGDSEILLDSAVAMFLAHNVCFRERDPLNTRTYLVFPALINLRKPIIDNEAQTEDGVAYTIAGATENAYAALVVLLGYTSTFKRTDQWHNRAQYVVGDDAICGFRVESEREGELDLVLYFGTDVSDATRLLFQSLVESFVRRRDVALRRLEPVVCGKGHVQERAVVRKASIAGREAMFCSECGASVQLISAPKPAIPMHRTDTERRTADLRTRFEGVLFRLATHVTQAGIESPSCFISYAWGVKEHEQWVEHRLATDLDKCGITVILDRWDNRRIGASVPRFVERAVSADRVIVVATPDYAHKYVTSSPMGAYVVAAEGELIGGRLTRGDNSVFPVLLDGDQRLFPPLLREKVYADFRKESAYFSTMLDLVLSLYDVGPREPVARELRSLLD